MLIRDAAHAAFRGVLVNGNRASHARDYKAESALVDGFISGLESPRLLPR
jgi:hypothetical protein